MKVCEKCRLVFDNQDGKCSNCQEDLVEPRRDDDYLKKFLEVDDAMLQRFKDVREATIQEAKQRGENKEVRRAIGIAGSARDEFDMAAESSNSEFLLKEALAELKNNGLETELIELRKCNIKPCKACYSTTNTHCHFYCSCYARGTDRADDMSNILYDKILAADIIIFATPINNFKMSSMTALFLDRCISLDGSLPPADPQAAKNRELNIKHTKFVEIMADENIPGSGFYRRFCGKTGGIIVTGHEEGATMVISSLFMALNHFGMAFAPWSNVYAMSSITNPTYKDKPIVNGQEHRDNVRKMANNALRLARNMKEEKANWKYDPSSN
jgi:multimeric flavodoxin WrbA